MLGYFSYGGIATMLGNSFLHPVNEIISGCHPRTPALAVQMMTESSSNRALINQTFG
jgi:hypothetical protein